MNNASKASVVTECAISKLNASTMLPENVQAKQIAEAYDLELDEVLVVMRTHQTEIEALFQHAWNILHKVAEVLLYKQPQ